MYCRTCGQEVRDEAEICVHCGCRLKEVTLQLPDNTSKGSGVGILLGLLGLIGLIIGLLVYPSGSVERKNFLKSWGITLGIYIVIVIIIAASVG